MKTPTITELREFAQQLPEKIPYLKMLVLFGSRSTGNTHAKSDWDFAVLCDQEQRETYVKDNAFLWFELPIVIGEIFNLNSDQIDVVELNQCSELISHFVARDGKLLYEDNLGEFEKFKQRSLLSNSELKKIENINQQHIEQFLHRWGV